jgi:Tfp pilus assembly protein PilP
MNSAQLVGVMWGQDDKFALVEDGEGFGYILRVGDRVRNGRVVSIRKNSLTRAGHPVRDHQQGDPEAGKNGGLI